MIELLILACFTALMFAGSLVLVLIAVKQERLQTEGRQHLERMRWTVEREEMWGQMKYLNDRYLAKHAGEAVGMDRAQIANERPDRERTPHLVPEGL